MELQNCEIIHWVWYYCSFIAGRFSVRIYKFVPILWTFDIDFSLYKLLLYWILRNSNNYCLNMISSYFWMNLIFFKQNKIFWNFQFSTNILFITSMFETLQILNIYYVCWALNKITTSYIPHFLLSLIFIQMRH